MITLHLPFSFSECGNSQLLSQLLLTRIQSNASFCRERRRDCLTCAEKYPCSESSSSSSSSLYLSFNYWYLYTGITSEYSRLYFYVLDKEKLLKPLKLLFSLSLFVPVHVQCAPVANQLSIAYLFAGEKVVKTFLSHSAGWKGAFLRKSPFIRFTYWCRWREEDESILDECFTVRQRSIDTDTSATSNTGETESK